MLTRFAVRFGLSLQLSLLALGAAAPAARAQATNACGCYRDDQGACKCTKKSKCGCPEECEPVGCEEKRQKQADREADAALKKIEARERKKGADAAKQTKASTKPTAREKAAAKGKPIGNE